MITGMLLVGCRPDTKKGSLLLGALSLLDCVVVLGGLDGLLVVTDLGKLFESSVNKAV